MNLAVWISVIGMYLFLFFPHQYLHRYLPLMIWLPGNKVYKYLNYQNITTTTYKEEFGILYQVSRLQDYRKTLNNL